VRPPSHCPRCGEPIRAQDNIPVLSYLFLAGRCRGCKVRISLRYPLVEALTAALSLGLWLQFGASGLFGVYLTVVAGLVAVTFIDIDHRIIPDSLSLGGVIAGLASSFVTGLGLAGSAIGAALGGGVLVAVALGYRAVTGREGMGLGDAKLLAAIGAFLGWKAVLFTIFVSSVVGSLAGLALVALRGSGMRLEVPFGPFLALGATAYIFAGPWLIEWYFGMMR